MSQSRKRLLFWLPRGLCLLFAVFLSLLALDVFSEGYSVGETLIALFMHLIPTFAILLALAVAWRWEGIGAILFAALGIAFILAFGNREDWLSYVILPGALFLVSILFLVNWRYRDEVRPAPK